MTSNPTREFRSATAAGKSQCRIAPAADPTRRKTDMVLARWNAFRGDRTLPSWADHVRIADSGLYGFCVAGHFGYTRAHVVTTRIGDHFLDQLSDGRATSDHSAYPAAVVMGVILTQSEQLFHDPRPLARDGEFLDMRYVRIRYRTVVVPFGEGKSTADHWLALGSWAMAGEQSELEHAA
jgi:hypothetical protein